MGLISGKVAAVALTGTLALGTVGFTFTGGETVDKVKAQLEELKNKVVQYEVVENSLFSKIELIKNNATASLTDANDKIVSAKTEINNLKASKSFLEKQIQNLNAEVTGLKAELGVANETIAEKEKEIVTLESELSRVSGELEVLQAQYDTLLADYNALVEENNTNKSEAERANAEVQAANAKVAELEGKYLEVDQATKNNAPMTDAELDAIGTDVTPDVYDAELVVQNLQLTYIQDGQSEAFKAAHPDLDIQEGDRVWRVTNKNAFAVYVEYVKGSENGELVANPSQTFYMTESGGTMIIKWQDENGVWKQTVKAGA